MSDLTYHIHKKAATAVSTALLAALQCTVLCRVEQVIKVGKGVNFGQKLCFQSASEKDDQKVEGNAFVWKDLGKSLAISLLFHYIF